MFYSIRSMGLQSGNQGRNRANNAFQVMSKSFKNKLKQTVKQSDRVWKKEF